MRECETEINKLAALNAELSLRLSENEKNAISADQYEKMKQQAELGKDQNRKLVELL